MNFLEIAKSRFSCREYTDQPISNEIISQLLEAAKIAPSAVNFQPWHFIVIQSPESREILVESYPREWFKKAPLYILACADHEISWKRPTDGKDHADIDLTIAIDHLILQAADLGLGTCWVCNFNPHILTQKFQLPKNIHPIAIIPIGYPTEKSDINRFENKRKKFTDFTHFEKW